MSFSALFWQFGRIISILTGSVLAAGHVQGRPISLSDYLAKTAAPIHLTLDLSVSSTVSRRIRAAEGGELSIKLSDGSIYQLVVPKDALLRDETIEISEFQPFSRPDLNLISPLMGVVLQPEGLEFRKPAKLNITLGKAVSKEKLVPISAVGFGSDLHLAQVSHDRELNGRQIQLTLFHFSSYAIGQSQSLAEKIFNAGTELNSLRIQSWLANHMLIAKREGKPLDIEMVQRAFEESFDKVIKRNINNINSCAAGTTAMRSLSGFDRQAQLLGFDISFVHQNYRDVAVNKTFHHCKEEFKKACYQDHRPFHVLAYALGFERQSQLMGAENGEQRREIWEIARKCMRFEFRMESEISFKAEGEPLSVKAVAGARFWMDDPAVGFQSDGKVKVVSTSFNPEGLRCQLERLDAEEKAFAIKELGLMDLRFDQTLGFRFEAMTPRSAAHFLCWPEDEPSSRHRIVIPPPGNSGEDESFWGGAFLAIHSQPRHNEYNLSNGTFSIFKWNVLYGEKFAEKIYNRQFDVYRERTTMTIYHRPEPAN